MKKAKKHPKRDLIVSDTPVKIENFPGYIFGVKEFSTGNFIAYCEGIPEWTGKAGTAKEAINKMCEIIGNSPKGAKEIVRKRRWDLISLSIVVFVNALVGMLVYDACIMADGSTFRITLDLVFATIFLAFSFYGRIHREET